MVRKTLTTYSSQVLGLREVLVDVVEFPLRLVGIDVLVHRFPGNNRNHRRHPPVMIEATIRPQLEVLRGVPSLRLGVVERIGEADAFDGLLRDAVQDRRNARPTACSREALVSRGLRRPRSTTWRRVPWHALMANMMLPLLISPTPCRSPLIDETRVGVTLRRDHPGNAGARLRAWKMLDFMSRHPNKSCSGSCYRAQPLSRSASAAARSGVGRLPLLALAPPSRQAASGRSCRA
jgi:hypothetical protein